MKIFFDGGCKPNPGMMEIGVVMAGVFHHERNIGVGSNNCAEWIALLFAAELAIKHKVADVEFIGDSLLVINQATGEWKCRSEELQPFLEEFNALSSAFSNIKLKHVRRTKNLAGIALENSCSFGVILDNSCPLSHTAAFSGSSSS